MQPLQQAEPVAVGPYALVARIGSGSMGRVFLGRSPGGRPVAVKIVRPELAGQPGFRERFRREVAAAGQISGAYTAPVLDADPEADTPWMATAYIAGPSLQQAVQTHGPLRAEAVRLLGAALAEALAAIHGLGHVHRDVKPANILLAADGPRIIDFGLVRALEETAVSATGQPAGSAGYQAPEQAEGGHAGPAADVFALGAVLAFAATGRPPFGEGHAHVLMYRAAHEPADLAGIPPGLTRIVAACLSKTAADRPAAGDLITSLRPGGGTRDGGTWLLPEPVLHDIARREATLAQTLVITRVLPPKRRGVLIGALAATGLAAVGGGAALWATRAPRRRPNGKGKAGAGGPLFAAPQLTWTARGGDGDRTPFVTGGVLLCRSGVPPTEGVSATDVRDGKYMWGQGSLGPLWGKAAAVAESPVLYGTSNTYVVAYTFTTGDALWSWRDSDSSIDYAPQFVAGHTLICTAATGDAVALDLRGRRTLWRRRLYSVPSNADLVTGEVWPDGGLFYLGDATGGSVVAFDLATGVRRWTAPGVAGATTLLADGLLFVGGAVHGLAALDARTGAVRWTSRLRAYSLSTAGGRLFVGGDGLAALDPATGSRHWSLTGERDGVRPDNGIAAFAHGAVVYVSGQRLYGVDPAVGRAIGSIPLPGLVGQNAVAVSSGNQLFVGNVHAILALRFPG